MVVIIIDVLEIIEIVMNASAKLRTCSEHVLDARLDHGRWVAR
jgi:hypothetical protein